MANLYRWTVTHMDTAPSFDGMSNVVIGAGWYAEARDDSPNPVKADLIGYTKFEEANSASFTPYEKLKKSQVLNWIWNTQGAKEKIETFLDEKIAEKKNPAVVNLIIPWVDEEPQFEPKNAPINDTPRNPFLKITV